MQLQEIINYVRSVDVSLNDTFLAFNRDGVIDIEALMQLFVQDTFEDFDFMSQGFNDAVEQLVAIYNGVGALGEFPYGGLPHGVVDDFARFGFTFEDRIVNEEEIRVIQTKHVTLIVERFGEDESPLDTGEQEEDED